VPWIFNSLQPADGAMLIVDLAHPGCMEEVVVLHELLAEKRIRLTSRWEPDHDADDDPFGVLLPTVLVANKTDLVDGIEEDLDVFQELTGCDYPVLEVSAQTGEGMDRIGPWLFERLGVVRVYTKVPGRAPDMGRPFTVRKGDTVQDVAMLVHRDIAASLRFARLWGGGAFDGQQVGADHVVADGDVLELHS
jgi:ribosome-interacting GTPase 1